MNNKLRVVMGVTTYNRLLYLKKFISTWENTRNKKFDWTLIISDDGSDDGTGGFLNDYQPYGYKMIINKWDRKGVSIGTNGILRKSLSVGFDFGFKADDDVFFLQPGWDELYINASGESKFQHLCYYNSQWKKARYNKKNGPLVALTNVENAMGCFWTFTPQLIDDIGWFDSAKFGKSGYEHIDYSIRACRNHHNDEKYFYDAYESNEYISMQGLGDKKNYIRTLNKKEQSYYWGSRYRRKCLKVIRDSTRSYIPENSENQNLVSVLK